MNRIQTKIESFSAPPSSEKYLRLVVSEKVEATEFVEDSELMEDLYKILPLTIDSDFQPDSNLISCQFDTLTDLDMAQNVLQLVFSSEFSTGKGGQKVGAKNSKSTQGLLQKLL